MANTEFVPIRSHQSITRHYDMEPIIDIYATPSGRDLGAVARDITAVLEDMKGAARKGAVVVLRG